MKQSLETIVLSLGGSLIVPDEINIPLLSAFREFIFSSLRTKKYRFVVVTGGGRITRLYQDAAQQAVNLSHSDLDWIGIYATRLNAQLVRMVLGSVAAPDILLDPTHDVIPSSFRVLISGGWKPGWSTDYVAVRIAMRLGVKRVLNLSNIQGVYNKDPKKFPDATLYESMSWNDFRKLLGGRWTPGMNTPFDPVAAREARKAGISVIVADGSNMGNIRRWLKHGRGQGTLLQ